MGEMIKRNMSSICVKSKAAYHSKLQLGIPGLMCSPPVIVAQHATQLLLQARARARDINPNITPNRDINPNKSVSACPFCCKTALLILTTHTPLAVQISHDNCDLKLDGSNALSHAPPAGTSTHKVIQTKSFKQCRTPLGLLQHLWLGGALQQHVTVHVSATPV